MASANFWVVRDERGLMLYYGPRPNKDSDGVYISTHPAIGRLPEGSIDIEPEEPVQMCFVRKNKNE